MTFLALFILVCAAFLMLPGGVYHGKPQPNWGGPHVYVSLASGIASIALAVWVLL